MVEILTAAYGSLPGLFSRKSSEESRSKLVLSKGHAAAALYAALREFGFFHDHNLEKRFGQDGSVYMTHASSKVPGVDFSTGSLGHGLPFGVGLALGVAPENRTPHDVLVVMGDGELAEGTTWESLLIASQFKLGNLTVIVDRNRLQSLDDTELTLKLEPLREKLLALGARVTEVDGHDLRELVDSLDRGVVSFDFRPLVIIANTIKGKGVSFMEGSIAWHYKTPDSDQLSAAIHEIEAGK